MPESDDGYKQLFKHLAGGKRNRQKPNEAPSAPQQEKIALQRVVSLRVEGPLVWIARRDGICKGFPHRIEHRTTYYRIDGKPYCPSCAQKKQANAAHEQPPIQ